MRRVKVFNRLTILVILLVRLELHEAAVSGVTIFDILIFEVLKTSH